MDTFFTGLSYNLVALFKSAQYKVQYFRTRDELSGILELYQRSLGLSDTVNRYFRLLICVQLLVASLQLCVLSYTLSENYAEPQMPFYLVFTLTVLLQLYIYCHCGEYLKGESQIFARAIYDSTWYEAVGEHIGVGRSLQFSMMRAQRGSHINGYFFEANMEVFLSVRIYKSINRTLTKLLLRRLCALPCHTSRCCARFPEEPEYIHIYIPFIDFNIKVFSSNIRFIA